MLQNYFKTAWRNLLHNKVYSVLNIFGLATGMAVALLIGLWVYYQYSYDRFLPGYQQNYQVRYRTNNNGAIQTQLATCIPLAGAIKKDIPGIQYVVQTDWGGQHGLVVGDKKLYLPGVMAGSDFLKMFQYPLLEGTAGTVLEDPYSIVLTQSTAKALFGNEDPVNKTVRVDNLNDLKVTGVLQDLPGNSTFQFNYIIPFNYYVETTYWVKRSLTSWGNNALQTFVALQPHVSYEQVAPKLKPLLQKYDPKDYSTTKAEVFMQPMKDWRLYSDFKNGVAAGGLIDYVKMFSITGILVLLIACINFMNLSTARSEKRIKEVGIRKAIGSQRKDLILQFLTESVILTTISFGVALLFAQLVMPFFNALTSSTIHIPYQNNFFWLLMSGYVLLTGLLAGMRPAFYLSSFRPVRVLKGTIQTGRMATLPGKILVVTQFGCSVALIISTIIVYQQIKYAKERPTGYNADRLLMTDTNNDLNKNYDALKNDLLQSGVVTGVTRSASPVTIIYTHNDIDDWPGKKPGETLTLANIATGKDYFKTLGMQLTAGRDFTGNLAADTSGVILNEAAVKRMQLKEPLNQFIAWNNGYAASGNGSIRLRVIGVVKDALMTSPFAPAEPTFFIYQPTWTFSIMYRLSPAVNTQAAIEKLTQVFNKYSPSYPYTYQFADESYAAKFNLEVLIGRLAGLFAALAIFISCLGLFGLAAYMAEQRTKEIGIRKVLGASVSQVWLLLSKDFVVLVLISCGISSPVAYYFLQNWLQQYDYRITISPVVFVIAGLAALLITIITISFQAIKAAMANPVKSLRTE